MPATHLDRKKVVSDRKQTWLMNKMKCKLIYKSVNITIKLDGHNSNPGSVFNAKCTPHGQGQRNKSHRFFQIISTLLLIETCNNSCNRRESPFRYQILKFQNLEHSSNFQIMWTKVENHMVFKERCNSCK